MAVNPVTFIDSDSVAVAKKLLGCKLVHETPAGTTSGIIVETEAYSSTDPASHSFRGQTARTRIMFGPAGYSYVYFTYGMHYCFNIVTGHAGDGQAVLIRALEPLEGLELMFQRRFPQSQATDVEPDKMVQKLCSGPAKLVQAMGITKADYGVYLLDGGVLRLEPGSPPQEIVQTTRIGIRQAVHKPWRFYIAGNTFISKP